jgi:EmrB/QacA subfamily drug resistance transporter
VEGEGRRKPAARDGEAATPIAGGTGRARERATLLAAILGLSVTILDETVVFVALPAMERDLSLGLDGQQWVVNGYLLTLAAFLLVGGALADLFGRRRLFLYGLAAFGVASLACALAPSGETLIAFRLAQGAAAAMLMPSTLALLTSCFEGDARAAAIGSWSAWGGVAAAVGPLVGGVLIDAFSWRAIFLLSLPLVAAAMALAVWRVSESRDEQLSSRRLDASGGALAALALGGLSFGLIQGPALGWGSATVIGAFVLSAAAGAGFVVRERRARAPMLPLQLFRIRNFTAANAATLALYGVFNGNFFILIIYLQTALGYSALAAGAASVPLTLMMVGLASRLGRLTAPLGPRRPMTLGLLLIAGGLGVLVGLEPGDSYWTAVLPGVVLFGLGLAFAVPPLTDAAVSSVPGSRSGLASAVNNAVARGAALLFVALLGLVFAVAFRAGLPAPESGAGAAVVERARERPTAALEPAVAGRAAPDVRAELVDTTVDAYRAAMLAGVLVALLGALLAWRGVQDPDDRCGLRQWLARLRGRPAAA